MKTRFSRGLLAAVLLWGAPAGSETPLARPLANFDELVSQLNVGNVVGEPVHVGDTAIVPFAALKFELGGGGGTVAYGGGMCARSVPLGILIVEGDEVRAELFPEQEATPSVMEQLARAVLERRIVIMGNGVNLGQASGSVQDLAPVVSGMMGQTTFVGNALNLGGLQARVPKRTEAQDLEAALAGKPSAEGYFRLGEAWRRQGEKEKAAAAYARALQLRPGYPEAAKALAELK
jgi:uncharacterized spore protein YtfJ